jgi:hypothetical protein
LAPRSFCAILASGSASDSRAKSIRPRTRRAAGGEKQNPAFPEAFDFYAIQRSRVLEKLRSI